MLFRSHRARDSLPPPPPPFPGTSGPFCSWVGVATHLPLCPPCPRPLSWSPEPLWRLPWERKEQGPGGHVQGGPAWMLVWGVEVWPRGAPGGPVSTAGATVFYFSARGGRGPASGQPGTLGLSCRPGVTEAPDGWLRPRAGTQTLQAAGREGRQPCTRAGEQARAGLHAPIPTSLRLL